jgi:hypothetical protein
MPCSWRKVQVCGTRRRRHTILYVLEGEVVYRHADKLYSTRPGDSLFFDADAPHGPEEMRKLPIRFLSIISYPAASSSAARAARVPRHRPRPGFGIAPCSRVLAGSRSSSQEHRLEDRFDDEFDRRLDNAVLDRALG